MKVENHMQPYERDIGEHGDNWEVQLQKRPTERNYAGSSKTAACLVEFIHCTGEMMLDDLRLQYLQQNLFTTLEK